MTPPATVQSVPTTVMVLGWTPRRTSQLATGSMTARYPFLSQSGRSFMRLRVGAGPGVAYGVGQRKSSPVTELGQPAEPRRRPSRARSGHDQGTGNTTVPETV